MRMAAYAQRAMVSLRSAGSTFRIFAHAEPLMTRWYVIGTGVFLGAGAETLSDNPAPAEAALLGAAAAALCYVWHSALRHARRGYE